jgi:hypothetical protein
MPTLLETRLAGLKVAVDVQHLYRASHPGDQGTVYTLPGGAHVSETHLSSIYALALVVWLRARGADVLTNDPRSNTLTGDYWTRNRVAIGWGAHAYLACHVNAGRGHYAEAESMKGSPGAGLSRWIVSQLYRLGPFILDVRTPELVRGDRGAVCIESFHRDAPGVSVVAAAALVEPFFGDCPAHQVLFASSRLADVAAAIGEGVARWWETRSKPAVPVP